MTTYTTDEVSNIVSAIAMLSFMAGIAFTLLMQWFIRVVDDAQEYRKQKRERTDAKDE